MLDGSTKFHLFQQDLGLKIWSWSTPPPNPPTENGNFSLGLRFESWKLTFKSWLRTPPPPTRKWDFSRFVLSIKSWKLVWDPPFLNWDFGILSDLDSVSKVRSWFRTPPEMGLWDFSRFVLSIKSWKLVWDPPPPPPPPELGLWDFIRFGLSIKSWKLVHIPQRFFILFSFGDMNKKRHEKMSKNV